MKTLLMISPLLALSACSLMQDPHEMKPGKWEYSAEIVSLNVPGATPAQIEQAKAQARALKREQCVSKEMASTPDAKMLAVGAPGCTASKFEIKDGKVDGKMSCQVAGGSADVVMTGTMEPEKLTIRTEAKYTSGAAKGGSMVNEVIGKRIGDC